MYKFLKAEEIQAQLNIAKFTADQAIEQKQEDIERIIENFDALREFASIQVSNSTEILPKQKTFLLAVIRNQVLDCVGYDESQPLILEKDHTIEDFFE